MPLKVSPTPIYKLTLLWAFAESGLGGLLHGLHIPVTGLVLGGFSVVLISFIAQLSRTSARDILQATFIVLIIKFAVSPHSPLLAYVAVFFQGILGSLIFSTLGRSRFSILLFSILALTESALQKPLLATLFFGTELWMAIDEMATKLMLSKSATDSFSFSYWAIAVYTGVHMLWGVLVGLWAYNLPIRVSNGQIAIERISTFEATLNLKSSNKGSKNFLIRIFILLFICLLVLVTLPIEEKWAYIMRTIAVIVLVYGILTPLVRLSLKKWSQGKSESIQGFWKEFPRLSKHTKLAWLVASENTGYSKRLIDFVVIIFWLTLFAKEKNG